MEDKKWYAVPLTEVLDEVNPKAGLTEQQVIESREKFGENKLNEEKSKSLISKFFGQFKDTMIIVLMVAAAISAFAPMLEGHAPEWAEAGVILAIVILNAVVGVVQEGKAESALKALKDMSSPTAKVIRNNKEIVVNSRDLVVGDVVLLEAGDLVPADIRLLSSSSLQVQESSLTGESVPVEKSADFLGKESDVLGDRKNMVYSSGMVTYGRGSGVITQVGMSTEVGKIASMLQTTTDTTTPLQRKLDKLGKQLGFAAILACVFVFVVGLIYQHEPLEMFLTAVSLAVAVIPEGLPAISTVVLAIGVQRLAKKHAIIRTLSSVETLGSATVICSDKTGTLTQNKMTVVDYWNDNHEEKSKELATAVLLCNDSRFNDGVWVGDPTETALSEWAAKLGIDTQAVLSDYERVNEIPFDSSRKRMTTINLIDDQLTVFTKGGLDEVLAITKYIEDGDVIRPITEEDITKIQDANIKMAHKALRVLSVAKKLIDKNLPEGDPSAESELVFIGLVGMIDPPRPEVIEAIKVCKTAGIRVVMITGDHAATAEAIADEIGLLEGHRVITGKDLDLMSDDDLYNQVTEIGVYARVSPEDKMRIIDAWKKHGEIVAMTGDGVNDAPALKKADIGAAMGIVGTEVAKSAADMVLTDDNFATVVTAVGEGRRIKDNIMKAINFLLSCNVGELLTLLAATIINLGSPLLSIHILWVNLVTDSLPALALGVDPEEEGIMKRKPDRSSGLLNRSSAWRIGYQGVMVAALTLFAYYYGSNVILNTHNLPLDEQQGQTMAFFVLAMSQLVHSFNIHSPHHSVFKTFFKNKMLLLANLAAGSMMILVLFVPQIREIFQLSTLDMNHWIVSVVLILIPLPLVEIMKKLRLNGND